MKKILITGANGQLGNEMRKLAAAQSVNSYIFTDVAELDICNQQAVQAFVESHPVDAIVNCAAYTAVDKAEEQVEFCTLLNATAVSYLAQAAQAVGASFIQVSTDYVFDGTAHLPYTEAYPTSPNSVYGKTKLAGEEAAVAGCSKAVVIRTSWLYSTFGNNFVKTMLRLGRERDTLGVIFDQVGTPTYAADLAEAIVAILEQEVVPGVYHYSNEGVCSWYDFTKTIHRIAGIKSCQVNPIHTADYPTAATRPHYSVMDKSKIKAVYGIQIPHWEESLERCMAILEEEASSKPA
ncbi:MAG: dTDP-4-dehydrorhamnose reductase [Phocaeicola sp.]